MHRALFLLAHPDDDFACSMWIRDHVRRGHRVHCAYVTDGGYGGQSVQVRADEAVRALGLLGVEALRIHFLGSEYGLCDGALHRQMETVGLAIDGLFQDAGGFDTVYLPAWEAGHQDHDAVHLVGGIVAHAQGAAMLRQFPLYHGAGLPGPFFRVMSPLASNGDVEVYRANLSERWLAIRVCLVYRSQWRSWLGLLPFFVWKMLVGGTFPVQPVNPARWREPAHPGKLLYERRGALEAAVFFAKARAFMAAWKGAFPGGEATGN